VKAEAWCAVGFAIGFTCGHWHELVPLVGIGMIAYSWLDQRRGKEKMP
jgi:hypothetical protein